MPASMTNPITLLFTLIFTLGISSLANSEPSPPPDSPITLTQDSTRIKTTPGATIQLQVRGNSGTGYVWSIGQIDPKSLKVLSTTTKRDKDIPGAAEFTIFSLESLTQGTSNLTLTYKRPWEKAPALTYKVIVESDKE